MKARIRNSNDNWQEIEYILLENSSYPQSADLMEFEQDVITTHDTLSTEIKTFDQAEDEKHWQDVRERAAIAAMQALMNTFGPTYKKEMYAKLAIEQADALIEQLKKRN